VVALRGPAAAVDRAVAEAVSAARGSDGDRLAAGLDVLARADPGHVRRLLTAAVRPALEARHPDGITGDDLLIVLREIDPSDPTALAVVLTGAFGVGPDAAEAAAAGLSVPPGRIDRAAVLLLAHLTPGTQELRRLLDAAWAEIARADHED